MILQHDNVRPHIFKPDKTYLEMLKWEVLRLPQYSTDIAPPDNDLFGSMAHVLAIQQFHSYEEISKCLDSWIASSDEQFSRDGIRDLPEIWESAVASDGQYFD